MTDYRAISQTGSAKSLFSALLAASFIFGATAWAEEIEDLSVTDALRLCAAFDDKDERLACFEALAAVAAPPELADADPNAPTTEDAAPPVTAPSASVEADSPEKSAVRPLEDDESLTFVRTKKGDKKERHAKKEKKRKRERYTLTVYKSWRNGLGELRIAFTNGEIWRQTGRGTRHDPQRGDEVVMKPGLLGGWTVSMDGGRFGVRMRPIN